MEAVGKGLGVILSEESLKGSKQGGGICCLFWVGLSGCCVEMGLQGVVGGQQDRGMLLVWP